jgi:hypothetical protein
MRMLVAIAFVALWAVASSSRSYAAVGQNLASTIDAIAPIEKAGCNRLGETGYHWYRFCFGPAFVYPHHRVCRHGYCTYW